MADENQGFGAPVPPSLIGYETGETLGQIPSSLRYRQFFNQYQPTVANSMGMHKLPPVNVRVPIADQYAIGIAHPNTQTTNPDPTLFSNVNGNISLGTTYEERREAQMGMRARLQQQARLKNISQIGQLDSTG